MINPYIPNTDADRRAMLAAIGVSSAAELFRDIPEPFRDPTVRLPRPLSELELRRELAALAEENAHADRYACFRGGGAYRHFVPAVVRHLIARNEFITAYTPYQPEVSQGTLQAIYEFQSLISLLTGMEVANAGMYDGASALAEAALMACRVTGRRTVAYRETLNPRWLEVVRTYTAPQGIALVPIPGGERQRPRLPQGPDLAAVLVQSPNHYGYLEDWEDWAGAAHEAGALLIAAADPIALGLFRPPGDCGADIAVAEGQPLGSALSFGGPYLGLFACQERDVRQMPSRIVGRTTDTQGREGFVLTLQPREQHIRRERATSNICTNEALVALAATVYLAALGPRGLREIAELCYHKAHYAARRIRQLPGYRVRRGLFFQEFLVECPAPPAELNAALLERGIIGGLEAGERHPHGMILCITEMNTRAEIDRLATALGAL